MVAISIFHMRAIWKGTIGFGLVSIPISPYPATRREELKFRLLRLDRMTFSDVLKKKAICFRPS